MNDPQDKILKFRQGCLRIIQILLKGFEAFHTKFITKNIPRRTQEILLGSDR